MQALLSFDKAPPFAAPLRFFLGGPLFAVAAGLLILFAGPQVFVSRWMPAALAATHLITIGFMLQIMLGALIQILPVVAGANLARPLPVAILVHGGLTAGALALAGGFLLGSASALQGAAIILGVTIAIFLLACGHALLGVPSTSPTIRGLKLALVALAVLVGLGMLLALALASGWAMPLPELADLHAAWAFGAWAGVLLAALAYVVVPMFQLTPGYPARPSWWLPVALFIFLILWTGGAIAALAWLTRVAQGLVALCGLAFALFTLHLQRQRRRARADATYRYWQLGLLSTVVAMGMLLAAAVVPAVSDSPAWAPLFGILLGVGGFMSFIAGMLYRIVPFLSWLHLQNQGQGRVPAPNMGKILPEAAGLRQMGAHAVALGCLVGAAAFPEILARPAGAALAVAAGWLFLNLMLAYKRYRYHGAEIAARLSAR